MSINILATKPSHTMPGLQPGKWVGVVDMEARQLRQYAAATPYGEPEIQGECGPEEAREFVAIAAAAYPLTDSGFVNVWIEVTA